MVKGLDGVVCSPAPYRSFIVPLYSSQFRVSRRYLPHPDSGGAPCPSRSFCRLARRPGPTVLTVTTRTRRRGLTCHRSVRRGRGLPRAEAIRLVPDVPSAAGATAVPPGPGFPLVLAAPVVLVALAVLAALVSVLGVLVALVSVPVVLVALGPVPRVRAAPSAVLAAPVVMAGWARSIPRVLSRREAGRRMRIGGVSPTRVGSPIRVRTNRCRRGRSGMNLRRTAEMCRRLSRVVLAGEPCGPRRAGGGGGSSWRAAWWSWPRPCSPWCC